MKRIYTKGAITNNEKAIILQYNINKNYIHKSKPTP